MKRMKKHKVKRETQEASARSRATEDHDLAYYIHDRVELMHQVFSMLKAKDLKAMAPDCVRGISINDLQELCTEQLLGISSKRLCAILDGAEPPSDTESSSPSASPAQMETISLDSISSDEEILSQGTKRKKHKHRHNKKAKKASAPASAPDDSAPRASRAGLTVLELLELQARARAIRAQLMQEQANRKSSETAAASSGHSSDGEVEIKEEPAEVVEISSDDEKPSVDDLQKALPPPSTSKDPESAVSNDKNAPKPSEKTKDPKAKEKKKKKSKEKEKSKKDKNKNSQRKDSGNDTDIIKDSNKDNDSKSKDSNKDIDTNITNEVNKPEEAPEPQTVTKRVKNLVITVPQQPTRKIKLNRSNKVSISHPIEKTNTDTKSVVSVVKPVEKTVVKSTVTVVDKKREKSKVKTKKKQKKKDKRKSIDKEGSDHDEITLELSDSEKMDLLENFDRKNYDNVSSSSSESSSGSDSDRSEETAKVIGVQEQNLRNSLIQRMRINEENAQNSKVVDENDIILKETAEIAKETNESVNLTVVEDISSNKATDSSEVGSSFATSNLETVNLVEEALKSEPVESKAEVVISNEKQTSNIEVNDLNDQQTGLRKDSEVISEENNKETSNPDEEDKQRSSEGSGSDDHSESEKSSQELKTTEVFQEPEKIEGYISTEHGTNTENQLVINNIEDIPIQEDTMTESLVQNEDIVEKTTEINTVSVENSVETNPDNENLKEKVESADLIEKFTDNAKTVELDENPTEIVANTNDLTDKSVEINVINTESESSIKTVNKSDKELSEGELSDNESSEVETIDFQPEVVCISDEENKDKKKKAKKSKKEKKSKKSKSDFRDGVDHNFYRDSDTNQIEIIDTTDTNTVLDKTASTNHDDDDVYEILELSDDSSCYEVEGTVLSKEPTAEEIEALSAKIDEIEREDVITDEQVREYERQQEEKGRNDVNEDNADNISWKDRYLGSKKVKRVLTTSNILNALRKKNKELKQKLEESKKEVEEVEREEIEPEVTKDLEEGSIDHYNTLQGSSKYVNPVPETVEETVESQISAENTTKIQLPTETAFNTQSEISEKSTDIQVTGEMKKDAKQLLKMYKKLLKYNDMNRKKNKDPNKKKKKSKKKKDKV